MCQLHSDPFFEDIFAYNLTLYVETPEESGVNTSYLSSPLVTLGRYEGMFYDTDAPRWVAMTTGKALMFRQPRGAMAEVFNTIAFWTENTSVVSIQLYWLH